MKSILRFKLIGLLAGLAVAAPSVARAQSGVADVVYTVGTVTRDSNGQDWAYILWQGVAPGLISNRVFAVYAKPGDPTNAAPYARRSIVTLQPDARVIEPLLRRAENLGDDMLKLQQDLLQVFGSFMPSNAITRADQLSAVMRGSLNDPRYYQNLLLLARNHAGINLALGFADAELIGPGRTTFEVRAYDPATDQDLAVIGRVTVQAGAPTILPPPGPPVLVPEASAMGDLNLKFRWGTPDDLRRLGLMQFGYNLYRVEKGYAALHGWNIVSPPPLPALYDLVATNLAAAKRVNRVPITPGKLFTLPDAANLIPPTGDTNTSFIMDDDGRGRPDYLNYGFTNGAQFYYYVAARDVLGRDGLVSTGLLATVCDRLPPLPPMSVHVLNDYQYDPISKTSTQALRVVWQQSTHPIDSVSNYWIYRWTNVAQMNALSGDLSNNLIAVVAQVPGLTDNSYLDDGSGSPTSLNAYGETYWYTVRAGDAGACGQNLSGPGGPAYGVLRDRVGPGPGSGTIEINCRQPLVNYLRSGFKGLPKGPDTNNYDLQLTCTRLDPRFEWAEFYGLASYSRGAEPPEVVSNYFGRLYYLGTPTVSAWWTPPRTNAQLTVKLEVGCRAALFNGKISSSTVASVPPPPQDAYTLVEFEALTQNIRTLAGGANQRDDCREHDPGGGGLDATNNIVISVYPSVGSKEYRIYRRMDDGPLSLLCQGAITNILSIIKCFEDAPPVNGGTICFYFQLLDESGNPGPLTPIGCVDTTPSTPLPVPVLAKITSNGDPGAPGMNLAWFCPPYGVERFELSIAGLPTAPNTNISLNGSVLSSLLASTGAPPVSITISNFGTNLSLPFYSFRTPKVGPGFGNNGAQFQVVANVEFGKTYVVAVRSLGQGNNKSEYSTFRTFVWTPTNAPSPQVPWPARPLPPTNANFFAFAFYLSPDATQPAALRTGGFTGNGVLIGAGTFDKRVTVVTNGPAPRITTGLDPVSLLETNVNGDPIFPCALYRYQVPNANFPVTSGDTIQVSPLMENIAYQLTGVVGQTTNTIVHDPFVVPTLSTDGVNNFLWLWLLDTQPQISGARYKYILVRFNPTSHEIDQLVPSSEVDVP